MKPKWQLDVKAELERRKTAGEKPSNEKELANEIDCAQSTMHDLLNSSEARHSSLVPKVHDALGWPPPPDPDAQPALPLPSPDALELANMYDRLPEEIKKSLRDQASTILRLIGKEPA